MNPMPVVMFLMGLDAREGVLEGLGFRKAPHPEGVGSSLYLGEEAVLHSTGLWYRGVLYHRPKERFYRTALPPYPPGVHPEAEPLAFGEGLAHFRPFLLAYQDQATRLRPWRLEDALKALPSLARRHRKDFLRFLGGKG